MLASAAGGVIHHSMRNCSLRTWRGEGHLYMKGSIEGSKSDIPRPQEGRLCLGFAENLQSTCAGAVEGGFA